MGEKIASYRWGFPAVLAGLIYLIAGIVFGAFAGNAPTDRMVVVWRLAAWLISGIAFGAHLFVDASRHAGTASSTALHVAVGVALGALGLAAAAIAHALTSGTGNLTLLAIALAAWPIITAIPAFLVALALTAVIKRMQPMR